MTDLFRVTTEPTGYKGYAYFAEHSWQERRLFNCPSCGRSTAQAYIKPFRVERHGSGRADFYGGGSTLLSEYSIANEVALNFPEIELEEVVFRSPKDSSLGNLRGLHPMDNICYFAPCSSIVSLQDACDRCGRPVLDIKWFTNIETRPDSEGGLSYDLVASGEPGILLDRSIVGNLNIFRFFDGWMLCTASFKEYVARRNWSNILIYKAGHILEPDDSVEDLGKSEIPPPNPIS